jgi:hypothetical protein
MTIKICVSFSESHHEGLPRRRRHRRRTTRRRSEALADVEAFVLERFDRAREVSTQTYPRKLDYLLLSGIAGLGASLSKFAADVRILSSPYFGELAEPFAASQVGSSAMPFKQNPILSERIGSLARLLPAYGDVAWQNAATNFLERTLDDSPIAHHSSRSHSLRRRDRRSRGVSSTVTHRRTSHRSQPTHLRAVCRQAVMLEAARAGVCRRGCTVYRTRPWSVGGGKARRNNPLSRLLMKSGSEAAPSIRQIGGCSTRRR